MASGALGGLLNAVAEVPQLLSVVPAAQGSLKQRAAWARVVGRAAVVLLSSHFERYFYGVNEEAVAILNAANLFGDRLPETMRLLHSKSIGDRLASTQWDQRAAVLTTFTLEESWLWSTGVAGTLDSARLLEWMSAPLPRQLVRYYRYWGIQDIFTAITRRASTRGIFWLLVTELVEKRNNIAHGDFSAQATRADVRRYATTATKFCERADRVMAARLGVLLGTGAPW